MDIYPIWLFGGPGLFGVLTGTLVYKSQLFGRIFTQMHHYDYRNRWMAIIARIMSSLLVRGGYFLVASGLSQICIGVAFATNINPVTILLLGIAMVLLLTAVISLFWQPVWIQPAWVRAWRHA